MSVPKSVQTFCFSLENAYKGWYNVNKEFYFKGILSDGGLL